MFRLIKQAFIVLLGSKCLLFSKVLDGTLDKELIFLNNQPCMTTTTFFS